MPVLNRIVSLLAALAVCTLAACDGQTRLTRISGPPSDPQVAGLSDPTGQSVTLSTNAGEFQRARRVGNPDPANTPAGVSFDAGFYDFTIAGLTPGQTVEVTLELGENRTPTSYYKYHDGQFLNFAFNGNEGAQFNGSSVTLTITDGGLGDDDGSANGVIVDPGAPGFAFVADKSPDAFVFTDITNQAASSVVTSDTVTITGVNSAADISVTGGEYSIGCDASGFTAATGTIENGQPVCVRHTTANAPATSTDTTLTIGGVSDTFTSTTAAAQAAFSIGGSINVTPSTSNAGSWELRVNGGFNNDGGLDDGAVTYGTGIADGSTYDISTVAATGFACTVTNGSGTISGADITNVNIACTESTGGGNTGGNASIPPPQGQPATRFDFDETATADELYQQAAGVYRVIVRGRADQDQFSSVNDLDTVLIQVKENREINVGDANGNVLFDSSDFAGGSAVVRDGALTLTKVVSSEGSFSTRPRITVSFFLDDGFIRFKQTRSGFGQETALAATNGGLIPDSYSISYLSGFPMLESAADTFTATVWRSNFSGVTAPSEITFAISRAGDQGRLVVTNPAGLIDITTNEPNPDAPVLGDLTDTSGSGFTVVADVPRLRFTDGGLTRDFTVSIEDRELYGSHIEGGTQFAFTNSRDDAYGLPVPPQFADNFAGSYAADGMEGERFFFTMASDGSVTWTDLEACALKTLMWDGNGEYLSIRTMNEVRFIDGQMSDGQSPIEFFFDQRGVWQFRTVTVPSAPKLYNVTEQTPGEPSGISQEDQDAAFARCEAVDEGGTADAWSAVTLPGPSEFEFFRAVSVQATGTQFAVFNDRLNFADQGRVFVGGDPAALTEFDVTVPENGPSRFDQGPIWDGRQFVLVDQRDGDVFTSNDGLSFTDISANVPVNPDTDSLAAAAGSGTVTVVVGGRLADGVFFTSGDGNTFTESTDADVSLTNVTWTGTRFVGSNDFRQRNGYVAYSADSSTWTLGDFDARNGAAMITGKGDTVLATTVSGSSFTIRRSTDGGATWTEVVPAGVFDLIAALHIDGDTVYISGRQPSQPDITLYATTDFQTYTTQPGVPQFIQSFAQLGDTLVGVSAGDQLYIRPDPR